MKIKDIIKKQTTIIAIAVILITIAVIGVSYAIFFDVSSVSYNPNRNYRIADINYAHEIY